MFSAAPARCHALKHAPSPSDGGRACASSLRQAFIILAVSALTVMYNLVVGVGVGVVLAALRFTYSASLVTDVTVAAGAAGGPKRYVLAGKLFFGSSLRFHTFFDVDTDPDEVPPAPLSSRDRHPPLLPL